MSPITKGFKFSVFLFHAPLKVASKLKVSTFNICGYFLLFSLFNYSEVDSCSVFSIYRITHLNSLYGVWDHTYLFNLRLSNLTLVFYGIWLNHMRTFALIVWWNGFVSLLINLFSLMLFELGFKHEIRYPFFYCQDLNYLTIIRLFNHGLCALMACFCTVGSFFCFV